MLKMLATVKIEVSGAMNGKSGVAGMTHSASQAGLKGQRELSAVRGSESDVPAQSTQELLQHSSDIADVVANCKRLREDEGFQNALELAYKLGAPNLQTARPHKPFLCQACTPLREMQPVLVVGRHEARGELEVICRIGLLSTARAVGGLVAFVAEHHVAARLVAGLSRFVPANAALGVARAGSIVRSIKDFGVVGRA